MADRVTLLWPSARWWCAAWVLGALPVQAPAQHTPATAAPHWQNALGMPFVRIPAGSFRMGSDESPESLARAYPQLERARFEQLSDEAPVHTVHITPVLPGANRGDGGAVSPLRAGLGLCAGV